VVELSQRAVGRLQVQQPQLRAMIGLDRYQLLRSCAPVRAAAPASPY
jgi:hypothetical protein